jgi:hypothetical protein
MPAPCLPELALPIGELGITMRDYFAVAALSGFVIQRGQGTADITAQVPGPPTLTRTRCCDGARCKGATPKAYR